MPISLVATISVGNYDVPSTHVVEDRAGLPFADLNETSDLRFLVSRCWFMG